MKKVIFTLIGLSMIVSVALAQMQSNSFKGSTPYQSGMTLEEAAELAAVSKEEAILAAQTLLGSSVEAISAEITVVDGFIVWAIDLGSQVAYIDVSDPALSSTQEVMADAYAGNEYDDDEYEEEEEEEEEDDDDYEKEDDDDGDDEEEDDD